MSRKLLLPLAAFLLPLVLAAAFAVPANATLKPSQSLTTAAVLSW